MESVSSLLVGAMVAAFGVVGLFLVAHAADSEMLLFGVSLAGFAIAFDFNLIRRHFNTVDKAHAAEREATHV
jgi:membrane protease YdiL (CAAX protease family)